MNFSRSLLLRFSLLFWLLCLGSFAAHAIDFPEKPADEHFFVDLASLLDADAAAQIDQIARQLLKDEGVALFAVTIPSLADYDAAGYSIEGYAADLFDEWGIGSESRNYGMLLLVSQGDRKARIELGAEWGRAYDRQAGKIMDTLIIPAFRNNDYAKGIVQGVKGMDAMARGLALPKPEAPWWFLPVVLISGIGLIALIFNLFKNGRTGWAWALIIFLGIVIFTVLRAASRGGGSSGGFGGGYSGGGGATGSW